MHHRLIALPSRRPPLPALARVAWPEAPVGLFTDLRMFGRFARDIGPYLKQKPGVGQEFAELQRGLAARDRNFLQLLERAVYRHPASPYLALLQRAGIGLPALQHSVGSEGVEATLEWLWESGVRVTLEEFKGRRPIVRDALELATDEHSFVNPSRPGHFHARSGGSRGVRSRLAVDFGILALEAVHLDLLQQAHGLSGQPTAIWWPAPPGSAGLKNCLRLARLGTPPVRWFSQTRPGAGDSGFRAAVFTRSALVLSRRAGVALPRPEHVSLDRAERVAAWLAGRLEEGSAPILVSPVGAAVRVCRAADAAGIRIAGSVFRVTGEPLTAARAGLIRHHGCRVTTTYSMTECGLLGIGCPVGAHPDSVHLLGDKMSVIGRPDGDEPQRRRLWLSTLHPSVPRVMINVESGDTAVPEEGACGCAIERAGFTSRLGSFRSYEKLTSEGMHLLAADVLDLLEDHLPRRFGGTVTDYQLVEDYPDGLPRISLYVRPEVGPVDSEVLLEAVRNYLSQRAAPQAMMGAIWNQGDTLRVVRAAPLTTPAAKIQPLHVIPRAGEGP